MPEGIYIFQTVVVLLLLATLESCEGVPITNAEKNVLAHSRPPPVNMGVDFNDEPVPAYMKNALANISLLDDSVTNEYNEFIGSPRLRKAIASLYSKLIYRKLNPENEVLVSAGGNEAVLCAIRALTKSVGEEWILIEPFYGPLKQQIELANAVPRFTNLKPTKTHGDISTADWYLDHLELQSLINSKTRGILFNNPNNPTGKSYNRADLEFIADLAEKYNLFIVSDEVHEFATDPMIRMATIPGMFERTITVGSASKAFGVPGWRAGWAYGPAELIERVKEVHAVGVGFAAMPIQVALSVIFENEVKDFGRLQSFLVQNLAGLKRQRDFIVQAFRNAGMVPIVPEAGYCMLAGWPAFQNRSHGGKNVDFSDWMSRNIGVLGFNAGNYYSPEHRHLGDNQLRFCYHKSNETLQLAAEKLLRLNRF